MDPKVGTSLIMGPSHTQTNTLNTFNTLPTIYEWLYNT